MKKTQAPKTAPKTMTIAPLRPAVVPVKKPIVVSGISTASFSSTMTPTKPSLTIMGTVSETRGPSYKGDPTSEYDISFKIPNGLMTTFTFRTNTQRLAKGNSVKMSVMSTGEVVAVNGESVDAYTTPAVKTPVMTPATVPIVPAAKQVPTVVKQVPTAKQVPAAKQVPVVKQVPAAKQVPVVKQVPAAKQVPTTKNTDVKQMMSSVLETNVGTLVSKTFGTLQQRFDFLKNVKLDSSKLMFLVILAASLMFIANGIYTIIAVFMAMAVAMWAFGKIMN